MIQLPTPYPYLASELPDEGIFGQVTLLGAPLDCTGSFRPGSAGGPSGIRWASENLETYSPDLDRDLEDMTITDYGDLALARVSMEEAIAEIEASVERLFGFGTLPFIFGGEHTISLPIARAVLQRYPNAMIVHFDAHADLRSEYGGQPITHATWAYHIGMEYGFDRLVQLGIRSGTREEFRLGRRLCRHFSTGLDIPDDVRAQLTARPVYLSLDIDVLDSSVVPGTGTPEPGGASYRELLACLQSLEGVSIVAMDINEVAPALDPTGVSAMVAAKLAREMMLLFGQR